MDDEDRAFFLRRLERLKEDLDFKVFALCLMMNHFHLVIRRGMVPLKTIMQRLLTAHARVFNDRWTKVGHTFQGRYGNRFIAGNADLMGVIRYVHLNPVEAGLIQTPDHWRWSGHRQIIDGSAGLIDTDFVIDLFGGTEEYMAFVTQPRAKDEIPSLDEIAGPLAPIVRSPDKTRQAADMRRTFILEALRRGYRRSKIASYLGRSPSAITQLLKTT